MDLFLLEPRNKPIGKYRAMMLRKKQRLIDLEQNYFAQFAGEKIRRFICDNCGAKFLNEDPPWRDHLGRIICCAHCIMNPQGCRCHAGEFGVIEDFWYDEDYEEEHSDLDYS